MSEKVQVGFSQRIKLEWLDRTAELVLMGNSPPQIRAALQDFLSDKLSKKETRSGNRGTVVSILTRTWVNVPTQLEGLRDDGLALLRSLPPEHHLAIHWGMTMVAYPFFGEVAETVGRLARLQATVTAPQVQKRLKEQFGERATVERAARRILRTFIDWSVLQDTTDKGVYKAEAHLAITDTRLVAWLVEAVLYSTKVNSASVKTFSQQPVLFPFKLDVLDFSMVEANQRLELFRQGLDQNLVLLK